MAKKISPSPQSIDLTSFDFVQVCGACHPGGGPAEYDRDNYRYDGQFTGFNPRIKIDTGQYLDPRGGILGWSGDYYQAAWQRTGVLEADCLLCHLDGYNYKLRARLLKPDIHIPGKFYLAPAVGAGWARVEKKMLEGRTIIHQVQPDYSKLRFDEEGKISLPINRKVKDENCLFCHRASDAFKRGIRWTPQHDVHRRAGLHCSDCHGAGERFAFAAFVPPVITDSQNHNLAKGNANVSTVRDDLDDTILKCSTCHAKGLKNAPIPTHDRFPESHVSLDESKRVLACEVCHIPYRESVRGVACDFSLNGDKVVYFDTPPPPKPVRWEPAFRKARDGKLHLVNPVMVVYWAHKDPATGLLFPVFSRTVREAFRMVREAIQPDKGIKAINASRKALWYEDVMVKTALSYPREVQAMAQALRRLGVANPVWVAGKPGSGEPFRHRGELDLFQISHGVLPAEEALGRKSCSDCHGEESPFMKRRIRLDIWNREVLRKALDFSGLGQNEKGALEEPMDDPIDQESREGRIEG